MVRQIRGALSLSLALLALLGCSSITHPWRTSPPPAVPLENADLIWQRLQERRAQFQDFKGLASVRVRTATQWGGLDETAVVLQRFDALRIEGIGPVGQPLFLLIADRERLELYAPREAQLLTGASSAANFLRLFGIALEPQALQYLLLGDVPLSALPTGGLLRYLGRDNLYLWQGQVPQQSPLYRVWFEPYEFHPVRIEVEDPPGQVMLQVRYEMFQQFGPLLLPSLVTIAQPGTARRVIWTYKDVQINTGVQPALLRMRVPPGTRRIAIEDLALPDVETLPRVVTSP